MTIKTKIFLLSVFIELVVVLSVGFNIIHKSQRVLGVSSVNIINKNTVIQNNIDQLKYFYEPKPGIETNNLGWMGSKTQYDITYTINSDTLNQKEEIKPEKSSDIFRILTLGDSFTFGQNVNTQDNYPSQLEKLLNKDIKCNNITKFEVINLGVGGYDTEYAVERFKNRGQKYNPDIVLWFVTDLDRIDELLLPKFDIYDEIMKKDGSYKLSLEKGDYYSAWHKVQQDVVNTLGHQQILNMQSGHFKEFRKYYDNKLLLFTFPFFEDKAFLKNIASTMPNTFFYDGIPNIYESKDNLPDLHPNKLGHTKISTSLYTYLVENKLIPCD